MTSWPAAALLLLGGSTILLFAGIPVAFSFLGINLVFSAGMNWYNRRVALVQR